MSLVFDRRFFRAHPLAASVLELFEHLPEVVFYAKDAAGRFVAANSTMLATKELRDPAELLGRTDRDFHPPALAEAYMREDRAILESGRPLPNQSWLVIDRAGRPGWFRSSKTPLLAGSGKVVGVGGVRYAISSREDRLAQFQNLAAAVQHLERHHAEPVSTAQLAKLAGLSVTHFNRRFAEIFRQSPRQFLISFRVEKARHLLATTDLSIGEVSARTGFFDQSHFTRHFRKLTGLTPIRYRRRFCGAG